MLFPNQYLVHQPSSILHLPSYISHQTSALIPLSLTIIQTYV